MSLLFIPLSTGIDPLAGHICSLSGELFSSEPTTLASVLLPIGNDLGVYRFTVI